jgi:ribonucleotide monophosphatase NagD (HAD superfamily)
MIGGMQSLPDRIRLVIFDLDGVVYRGTQPVDGAADLVRWLHERGVAVRFATNNSMVAREGYVERLGAMGIPTAVDEIVTSTSATVVHLQLHAPHVRRVLAIGADGMRHELESAGFAVDMAADVHQDRPGAPLAQGYDAVIVGLDPGFDYHRLSVATSAVSAGADLVATNADARYPTPMDSCPVRAPWWPPSPRPRALCRRSLANRSRPCSAPSWRRRAFRAARPWWWGTTRRRTSSGLGERAAPPSSS